MNLTDKIRVTARISSFMLLLTSVSSYATYHALAETVKKGKLTALEGFAEQTPKFDTRVADVQFQLGANETILRGSERKNLLHAKAKLRNLRAKADQFYLKTTKNDVPLKSRTATAAASHPLEGKVDKNEKRLQARIAEVARTPFNTLERDVHAPFQLDLDRLMTKVAPNLSSAIDAEIDRAPVNAADRVAREVREMEPLLNARTPRPEMPAVPPRVQADVNLSRAFDTETKTLRSAKHNATADDTAKIDKAIDQGERMHGDGQKLDGLIGAFMSQFKKPDTNVTASSSNSNSVDKTAHEIDSQMLRVKEQVASGSNIDAELNAAKKQSRTSIAVARSNIDAILTHARSLPQKSIPEKLPNAGISTDVDDVVSWDRWHANFAQLARDPIFNNVRKLKMPSGANCVQITVTRGHSVTVTLVKPSNPAFDNAVVLAYKALNQNPNLEFPRLSRRQSITFVVDNEHKGSGTPTGVQSQPSVGDKEVVEHRI